MAKVLGSASSAMFVHSSGNCVSYEILASIEEEERHYASCFSRLAELVELGPHRGWSPESPRDVHRPRGWRNERTLIKTESETSRP